MFSKTFAQLIECLLIATIFLASGCTQNALSETGQTINLNIESEPPSLDPRKATDLTSAIVLKMLYDGLTRLGTNGKSRPSSAESIIISNDLKKYTFKLRNQLFWSNGDPVTAYDFEYAWKWTLTPGNNATYAYQLYVIKNGKAAKTGEVAIDEIGVHAVDDKTLIVELENPTPYFLELTSLMMFYPIHRKMDAIPDQFSQEGTLITNGPFSMTSWKHNNEIIVKKNTAYWDASSVTLDKIRLLMVPDANTELNMFEKGELDWAGTPLSIGLPSDAIPQLKELGQLHIKAHAATYFYELNTERFPLNHQKLRKALAYAIDRKAIIENITQSNQIAATGILPTPLALQSEPYFQDNDIAGARQLFQEFLKELHMDVKDLPILTLSYNTSEGHHRIAQAIQQQWKKALGITIQLENLEWKVYLDKLKNGDFDIARMSWVADFNDPITFLNSFTYKQTAANNTGWENAEYTKLIGEASIESNHKKRREILNQAEKILVNEMPIIPIYYLMNCYLKNPRLQNVLLSGLGDIDFKWAYMED